MDQIFIANASYLGSYDNALAGEEATDYLYEMGHRRIAYFGVSNAMLFSAERRRGYQMSLLKHGITPQGELLPTGSLIKTMRPFPLFLREAERPHFVYFFRYSRGVMPKCALNARLK